MITATENVRDVNIPFPLKKRMQNIANADNKNNIAIFKLISLFFNV
jgi:hypothetical protein